MFLDVYTIFTQRKAKTAAKMMIITDNACLREFSFDLFSSYNRFPTISYSFHYYSSSLNFLNADLKMLSGRSFPDFDHAMFLFDYTIIRGQLPLDLFQNLLFTMIFHFIKKIFFVAISG